MAVQRRSMRSCFSGHCVYATRCRWRRRRQWTGSSMASTRASPLPSTSPHLRTRWRWWRAWRGGALTHTHKHNANDNRTAELRIKPHTEHLETFSFSLVFHSHTYTQFIHSISNNGAFLCAAGSVLPIWDSRTVTWRSWIERMRLRGECVPFKSCCFSLKPSAAIFQSAFHLF